MRFAGGGGPVGERGGHAHVDGGLVPRPAHLGPSRVHAVAERTELVGHLEVGCAKPQVGPFPATGFDGPGHEVGPPEQPVRLLDVACGQKQPDARGRDGRAVVAFQAVRPHLRAARKPPGIEVVDGAARAGAELEIEPHVQIRRRRPVEGLRKELRGARRRELAGERQHAHGVHPRGREHRQALLVRHELLEAHRVEHLVGIDVERERDAPAARARGAVPRAVEQEPMPPVHAVEHAEGTRGALEEAVVERVVGLNNLCHETPPSETRSAP